MLRFATAGSVDDGKSTLIGRLLYDSKSLLADQVADAELDLARLTDGLRAEREQGITIDVAYRHFSTPRRRFIIADTPGHAQYTRNMVTGASTADVAVVLVDAREGLLTQSRRHAAIAGLLGIPRIVLAVNKMDLVEYDADRFRAICADFRAWAGRLEVEEITCIPISALVGDNVVERSEAMDWYRGPTLLEFLEGAPAVAGAGDGPLRLPVQYVIRAGEQRAYAGQLAGGTVRVGDEVVVLPSGLTSRVSAVEGPGGPLEEAGAPLSVAVSLEDELDVGRGALICRPGEQPRGRAGARGDGLLARRVAGPRGRALPAQAHDALRARQARRGARDPRRDDAPGAAGRRLAGPERHRAGGAALRLRAGLRPVPGEPLDGRVHPHRRGDQRHRRRGDGRRMSDPQRSANVVWQQGVGREQRWGALGHGGATVWMTGLPASGKSTVAAGVEAHLLSDGRPAYVLDGDNLRHGLNGDLGFSAGDRAENVRRTAEVSALLADAGVVVLVALVSPYRADRDAARAAHDRRGLPFLEVWVATSLEECERRDPKGLYARARTGELKGLTGVDDPYEPPESPDVIVRGDEPVEDAVARVVAALRRTPAG